MHRTTTSRRRVTVAVAVPAIALVAALASGCGLLSGGTTNGPDPTSAPSGTPAPGPTATMEDGADVRARVLRDGAPLASGDVTLVVLPVPPHGGEATPQPDGSTRWEPTPEATSSHQPASDGASASLLVAAPDPLVLDLLLDGTVVVRRDGAPVAGLSSTGSGRLTGDGPVLELHGDPAAGLWLASRMVEELDWGDREGGRSLVVTPSDWARSGGLAADELVPAQVVAAEPEAGTPTMLDQLACHQLGAPDKATWNLEPWRPDVGPIDMIVARCNPTA